MTSINDSKKFMFKKKINNIILIFKLLKLKMPFTFFRYFSWEFSALKYYLAVPNEKGDA